MTNKKKKRTGHRKKSLGVTVKGEYRKNKIGQGRKIFYEDGDLEMKIPKSFSFSRGLSIKLKEYSEKLGVSQSSILEDVAKSFLI